IQIIPECLNGLRPKRTASFDACLGPGEGYKTAVQIESLHRESGTIGVAECTIDSQVDHRLEINRRNLDDVAYVAGREEPVSFFGFVFSQDRPVGLPELTSVPDLFFNESVLDAILENRLHPRDGVPKSHRPPASREVGPEAFKVITCQVIDP